MDIVRCIQTAKANLAFLEGLADKSPRLYSKSKDRLRELADICSQMVNVAVELIKDETLKEDSDEFESSVSVVSDMVNSIQTSVDELSRFTSSSEPIVESTPSEPSMRISAKRKHLIIQEYSTQLRLLAESNIPYPEASDLSKLIWRWFDSRFIQSANLHPNFKYNIRRVPNWIYDIILLYGHHLHEGTKDDFVSSFCSWCDSLSHSEAGEKWAVPYSVFEVDKHQDEYPSMEAAVLSDILFNFGLDKLDRQDPIYLDRSYIYNLISDKNSDILDLYNDYEYDPKVLTLCGISRGDS